MFGLFIITRNRPFVLQSTLNEIFSQTLPPDVVLVVDNSDDSETEKLIRQMGDSRLQYHRMGYNAGPAGGAITGMKILFEQGLDWVIWGDDDDPPHFQDVIENLFALVPKIPLDTIGIIGAVGVCFSVSKAKTVRISDEELEGIIEVDNVAGNMFPLIHRNVYEKNVFPDEDLFFGFEELDFCLSVKRAGLKIYVSGEELLRHRKRFGRLGMSKKFYNVKNTNSLWREYYSARNLIHIVWRKEKSLIGVLNLIFRTLTKMVYGFRFGLNYGKENFRFLFKGLCDGIFKRMGMTVVPVPKVIKELER